jgi:Cof subfamily protein (haloacid dehalogenase superfamily)
VSAERGRARGDRVGAAAAERAPRLHRTGLDTWQINYNGALVWDEPKPRPCTTARWKARVVRQIIDAVRDRYEEVLVGCEILDRWCTDRFDQTYTTETGRLFKPDLVAPLEEFLNQPVTKLMFLADRSRSRARPRADRPRRYDVSIVRSDPQLIQIMDAGSSKGAALRRVAKHYGVPMEQVMALGDAVNDVPMLEAAGVAVAMDNAHPDVKAVADWVAPSNNDHGVHAALVKYGLCE